MSEGSNNRGMKLGLLAGLGLVVLLAAWWSFRTADVNIMSFIELGAAKVRELGPVVFFLAMAVLPAVGAPLTLFTLPAGSVFAPVLGMPLVLLFVWLSIAVNLAMC